MSTNQFNHRPMAGLVFFNPWASCYTARKKLTPADLGLSATELPPATLASLGSMHSADPKDLNVFSNARSAMYAACLEFGTKCMGGFAVPAGKAIEVGQKLDDIKSDFYANKAGFLRSFSANREEWLRKPEFSQWTDKIRARLDTVEHVDGVLQCGWEAFTIGGLDELPKAEGDSQSPLAQGVVQGAVGLGDQALSEVAQLAQTTMRQSLYDDNGNKRVEVTQKILSPVRRIRDKLDALSFVNPMFTAVVNYINGQLAILPSEGKMNDKFLLVIFSLIESLSTPEGIKRMADIATSSAHAGPILILPAQEQAALPLTTASAAVDGAGADNPGAPVIQFDEEDSTSPDRPTEVAVAPAVATPSGSGEVVYDEC